MVGWTAADCVAGGGDAASTAGDAEFCLLSGCPAATATVSDAGVSVTGSGAAYPSGVTSADCGGASSGLATSSGLASSGLASSGLASFGLASSGLGSHFVASLKLTGSSNWDVNPLAASF